MTKRDIGSEVIEGLIEIRDFKKEITPLKTTEFNEISSSQYLIRSSEPGKLDDTLVFEKDIVCPLGEDTWGDCQ